jgi:hypothetical protein
MTSLHQIEDLSSQGTYFVYALYDPRNSRPYYVGCTKNPAQRWAQHRSGKGKCSATPITAEVRRKGLKPVFTVLESVTGVKAASDREHVWIEQLRSVGPLTNHKSRRPYPRRKEPFFTPMPRKVVEFRAGDYPDSPDKLDEWWESRRRAEAATHRELNDPTTMGAGEMARTLGCDLGTVYRLIRLRRLEVKLIFGPHIHGVWRISRKSVEEYIRKRRPRKKVIA